MTHTFESLVQQLNLHTAPLLVKYLVSTESWAHKSFKAIENTSEQSVIDQYGYMAKAFGTRIAVGMRHTKASDARWTKMRSIKLAGEMAYVNNKMAQAKVHYHDSINKLAQRIISKLSLSDLTLCTDSNMEMGNISTTITDSDGNSVRAFTILAWGEINAPHYRYLIK